jgi:hypothetical protein
MNRILSREHWLERVVALRVEAASIKTPAVRQEVLRIALGYERLAEHAEQQRSLWLAGIELTPVSNGPER